MAEINTTNPTGCVAAVVNAVCLLCGKELLQLVRNDLLLHYNGGESVIQGVS